MYPMLHSIQSGEIREKYKSRYLVELLGSNTRCQLAVLSNLLPPGQCGREWCSGASLILVESQVEVSTDASLHILLLQRLGFPREQKVPSANCWRVDKFQQVFTGTVGISSADAEGRPPICVLLRNVPSPCQDLCSGLVPLCLSGLCCQGPLQIRPLELTDRWCIFW